MLQYKIKMKKKPTVFFYSHWVETDAIVKKRLAEAEEQLFPGDLDRVPPVAPYSQACLGTLGWVVRGKVTRSMQSPLDPFHGSPILSLNMLQLPRLLWKSPKWRKGYLEELEDNLDVWHGICGLLANGANSTLFIHEHVCLGARKKLVPTGS